MKHIVIGDIHGKSVWKSLVNLEYDKFVFVGDYFDSFTEPGIIQLNNFNEIIKFKKDNPDKVELLIGNHDYHYFPGSRREYSRYNAPMRNDFENALYDAYNEGLLNVCYEYNNYLFSHAGLTNTWCKNNDIDMNNIVNSVNELFRFKPGKFEFKMGNNFSNTGNDITQGPFWVRPQSLYRDCIDGYKFVVGHTSYEFIKIFEEKFILIDCLDTVNQYLEIIDDECKIIDFI